MKQKTKTYLVRNNKITMPIQEIYKFNLIDDLENAVKNQHYIGMSAISVRMYKEAFEKYVQPRLEVFGYSIIFKRVRNNSYSTREKRMPPYNADYLRQPLNHGDIIENHSRKKKTNVVKKYILAIKDGRIGFCNGPGSFVYKIAPHRYIHKIIDPNTLPPAEVAEMYSWLSTPTGPKVQTWQITCEEYDENVEKFMKNKQALCERNEKGYYIYTVTLRAMALKIFGSRCHGYRYSYGRKKPKKYYNGYYQFKQIYK